MYKMTNSLFNIATVPDLSAIFTGIVSFANGLRDQSRYTYDRFVESMANYDPYKYLEEPVSDPKPKRRRAPVEEVKQTEQTELAKLTELIELAEEVDMEDEEIRNLREELAELEEFRCFNDAEIERRYQELMYEIDYLVAEYEKAYDEKGIEADLKAERAAEIC